MTSRVTHERERELIALQRANAPRLLAIPGVHGIGIGLKCVGGKTTGELSLIVAVSRKRPLDDIPLDERVPTEIGDLKTDVEETGGVVPHVDELPYRPLSGGCFVEVPFKAGGTLGCLAQTVGPDGRVVGLTNQHVIFPENWTSPTGFDVGQPTQCTVCSPCCSDTIGTALKAVSSKRVDGAIILLNPGMTYVADIIDIGAVAGTRDLTVDDVTAQTRVQKRGVVTGLTSGIVKSVTYTGQAVDLFRDVNRVTEMQIWIQADPQFPRFTNEGDSGSALLDMSRNVVGLMYGGDPRGAPSPINGYACPIADVQTELGITILTAQTRGDAKTVASSANEARPPLTGETDEVSIPIGGMGIRFAPGGGRIYRDARETALRTAIGAQYSALYDQHGSEVREILATHRRTAAVWRREGGPEIVQNLARSVREPARPFPAAIAGRPLAERVYHIADALREHASPGLARALDAHEAELAQLAGKTYRQLILDAERVERRAPNGIVREVMR